MHSPWIYYFLLQCETLTYIPSALASSYYNNGIKDLYFDQCFTIVDRIGCGSYGEVSRLYLMILLKLRLYNKYVISTDITSF